MKQLSLDLICCPSCKSALSLESDHSKGIITTGSLTCSTCSRIYPVTDGIVEFVQAEDLVRPNRQFARYYDRLSPFYSLFIKLAFLPFGGERKARQEILKHLDLVGGRTLEVSIGNGANLPYLFSAADAGEIFGIDLSIG
jgi:uncharacterized protein YbaR (Trm112 family)